MLSNILQPFSQSEESSINTAHVGGRNVRTQASFRNYFLGSERSLTGRGVICRILRAGLKDEEALRGISICSAPCLATPAICGGEIDWL